MICDVYFVPITSRPSIYGMGANPAANGPGSTKAGRETSIKMRMKNFNFIIYF